MNKRIKVDQQDDGQSLNLINTLFGISPEPRSFAGNEENWNQAREWRNDNRKVIPQAKMPRQYRICFIQVSRFSQIAKDFTTPPVSLAFRLSYEMQALGLQEDAKRKKKRPP